MCVWGQQHAFRSEEACRNAARLWWSCCLCSTNIRAEWRECGSARPHPALRELLALSSRRLCCCCRGRRQGHILMRGDGVRAGAVRPAPALKKSIRVRQQEGNAFIPLKQRFFNVKERKCGSRRCAYLTNTKGTLANKGLYKPESRDRGPNQSSAFVRRYFFDPVRFGFIPFCSYYDKLCMSAFHPVIIYMVRVSQ